MSQFIHLENTGNNMSFRSFMIAFISLLIAAYFLAILTDGLRTDDSATLSVLTTYLKTGVIVSFFLLGRYINSLNDKVFSRRLFNGVLILVVLSVASLALNAYMNHQMPYAVALDSLVYFYMYAALPFLISKPNKFLLRLMLKISKPF